METNKLTINIFLFLPDIQNTKVVSSNHVHGDVYSVQQYVIKFVSTPVSSTNKTGRHNITEILLKVALNTINLNLFFIVETNNL